MKQYFNDPQQEVMYTAAKDSVIVGGRGIGKGLIHAAYIGRTGDLSVTCIGVSVASRRSHGGGVSLFLNPITGRIFYPCITDQSAISFLRTGAVHPTRILMTHWILTKPSLLTSNS